MELDYLITYTINRENVNDCMEGCIKCIKIEIEPKSVQMKHELTKQIKRKRCKFILEYKYELKPDKFNLC